MVSTARGVKEAYRSRAPGLSLPLRILLAVDDSPYSAAAVSLLGCISWPAGTSIHVLAKVPEHLPMMDSSSSVQRPSDEALEIRRWRDWAAAKILTTQAANKLQAHDLLVETEICEGRLSTLILKRAVDILVDLIVIGARGHSTLGEFRLGAAAHKLTHCARCSVLVVRPWEQVRPLSTILAVDGSPQAWRAVEFVCALSLPNWARVTLVNVAEDPASGLANVPEVDRCLMRDTTEKCIADVAEHLHNWGAQVRHITRFGHPADEILSAAQERDAVLIVIGARDQTHTESYRLGDVAEKVVRYASCSVLAVRGEKDGSASRRGQGFYFRKHQL